LYCHSERVKTGWGWKRLLELNQRQVVRKKNSPNHFDVPFCHIKIYSYLRVMKVYLKTPTSDLTTNEIRHIVGETIKWCEKKIGTKHKRRTFKYRVLTLGSKCSPAYGMYCPTRNTLYVFKNHAHDVKMVIRAVLHEYTHFMQNLRYYNNVLAKVGYDKHPQEKQARAMEYFYGYCWKQIKNKL